jgi:hypothetical protein
MDERGGGAAEIKSRVLRLELSMQRVREHELARGERRAERDLGRAQQSFVETRRRLTAETRSGSDPATVRAARELVGQLVRERRDVTTATRHHATVREALTAARGVVAGTLTQLDRLAEIVTRHRVERAAEREGRELEDLIEARVGRSDASATPERSAEVEVGWVQRTSGSDPWSPPRLGGGDPRAWASAVTTNGVLRTETREHGDGGEGRTPERTATPLPIPQGISAVRSDGDGQSVAFTVVGSQGAKYEVDLVRRAGGGLDVVLASERLRDRHRLWGERAELRQALIAQGYTVHGVRVAGAPARRTEEYGHD